MKEKRSIEVSLEQAVEWYYSDNKVLRKLALEAYTKSEMESDLQYITKNVHDTCVYINVPVNDCEKYKTLADLAIIAKFFNGDWKKTTSNRGFLICKNSPTGIGLYIEDGISIVNSTLANNAGTIYFKNRLDAVKAIKILGKRVKNLFD